MLGLPPKKNRNKKGLLLSSESASTGTIQSENSSTTTTNTGPVQVTGSSRSSRISTSSVSSSSSSASQSTTATSPLSNATTSRSSYHNTLSEQLATLELGVEFKLDLRSEDLQVLSELGAGNGGTVSKCLHVPTKAIMAKKVVHIATSAATRKQILRELQIMHDCSSPFIVSFYGAYLSDPHICMCMEYMDKGSLDGIYKKMGPIPEPILAQIALAVVNGLTYLYEAHKIMHRDVKPSNILLNSAGQIKICDFGVSGELINSVADTFVGTSVYMSPERIFADPYTVKSDVWSLGITLVELAIGRFPFSATPNANEEDDEANDNDRTLSSLPSASTTTTTATTRVAQKEGVSLGGSVHQMSILELLQYIMNEAAPSLPFGGKWNFSKEAREFADASLRKEPVGGGKRKKGEKKRPTPKELLDYAWLVEAKTATTDAEAFAKSIP